MATKQTKPTKPTYNQLMRERKKDHEDIIAKAARITALETDLNHYKVNNNGLLHAVKELKEENESLKKSASENHNQHYGYLNEINELKQTIRTILKIGF